MEYEFVRLEVDRPLARIVLARKDAGNAISARTLRELAEATSTLRDDGGVRAVLLAAEGPDFCVGWDADSYTVAGSPGPDAFGVVAALPQPVVCAVRGAASSAGLELALAADVRICAANARFALPETARGELPRAGGTQRLTRLAGPGTALAMVLAGEELDARAALRAGLVADVVEGEDLEEAAEEMARRIAARGPIATRFAKEAIVRGLDMTLEQALRYETDLTIILQTTDDRAEGVRAFIEKRKSPDFKGK